MEIIINGLPAALPSDSSFEYVAENRLFTGADGYTLTITFPLKDCEQNLKIFGHINRTDVSHRAVTLDCEIHDKTFHRYGCITITSINDKEVKTQFLDGRSAQNYDDKFDSTYINEIPLGEPKISAARSLAPTDAWNPAYNGEESVALPWVNNNSDSGLPHNFAHLNAETNTYEWEKDVTTLTFQPYLLFITKQICRHCGYTFDFSEWENNEEYRYLLICNCLPQAWDVRDYARALPHWSINEFFEKLELFLYAEFDIDHKARHITFRFIRDIIKNAETIKLDKVVSDFNSEITDAEDSDCDYIEAKNLAYKEAGYDTWKYYSCDWVFRNLDPEKDVVEYDTMAQLLLRVKALNGNWDGYEPTSGLYSKILHVKDLDMYFILYTIARHINPDYIIHSPIQYYYDLRLIPLNIFGERIRDNREDASKEEIEFVPAHIDYTDENFGYALYLEMGSFAEPEDTSARSGSGSSTIQYRAAHFTRYPFDYNEFLKNQEEWADTPIATRIAGGKTEDKPEYYSQIFIAWWDGDFRREGNLPHPYVEEIEILPDFSGYINHHFSLRLNDHRRSNYTHTHSIDKTQKTTFKFLLDKIPSPRSIFLINGKRYIAEKITATFTPQGMSQLLKGDFYPIA